MGAQQFSLIFLCTCLVCRGREVSQIPCTWVQEFSDQPERCACVRANHPFAASACKLSSGVAGFYVTALVQHLHYLVTSFKDRRWSVYFPDLDCNEYERVLKPVAPNSFLIMVVIV